MYYNRCTNGFIRSDCAVALRVNACYEFYIDKKEIAAGQKIRDAREALIWEPRAGLVRFERDTLDKLAEKIKESEYQVDA